MKFKVEFKVKLDTDSKNKGELFSKIKKKAIDLAGKALDAAATALLAVEDAIDNAGDALLEAELALDEKNAENNSDDYEEYKYDEGDSDEDDDD